MGLFASRFFSVFILFNAFLSVRSTAFTQIQLKTTDNERGKNGKLTIKRIREEKKAKKFHLNQFPIRLKKSLFLAYHWRGVDSFMTLDCFTFRWRSSAFFFCQLIYSRKTLKYFYIGRSFFLLPFFVNQRGKKLQLRRSVLPSLRQAHKQKMNQINLA